ncbi:hypothetical protein OYG07_02495 [Actinobacillus pleuropneumoniae]|uniref:Uncharacterized protein n=1 Tax=Actinobacillus pleuropneumoniae TaxID=715 RepID=A0A9Q4DH29_ACTPL|nr:hypothetical protein [Actinobacillus pleuropneumoniae]MCL7721937.1 hypothetical protein [Actinobacillus pleuropneumoniae]MCL7726839.1 hypothetical protein [Actinobacillus pleuropneumoniae]MCL7730337.1 hypothetical protein [Actinobacillus pleuropneumoniae]MCY6367416.1 hypothetical protein [Actinobacillus pleuropneumoniae]MCY6384283.1 hypothetical protein [Actinobacillus pleuropneumoniae]
MSYKLIVELHKDNDSYFAELFSGHGEFIATTKSFAMIEDVKESVKRNHPSLSRKRQIKFKDLTGTDESLQANLQAETEQVSVQENSIPAKLEPAKEMLENAIKQEEIKMQELQIAGFKQTGNQVTIYFANGKSRKTTTDRLFNINKPSKAESIVKRVRNIMEG